MRAPLWRSWSGVLAIAAAAALAMTFGVRQSAPPAEGSSARLDFTLKDMNGATVHLADYKGRPVILNFWATWCGPCRLEVPALIAVADKYKGDQLAVLGVSVDDKPEVLRPFAQQMGMNYPVLVGLGHDQLQEAYDAVMFVPVTWFIRRDGSVQTIQKGPAEHDWFDAQARALVGSPAGAPQ